MVKFPSESSSYDTSWTPSERQEAAYSRLHGVVEYYTVVARRKEKSVACIAHDEKLAK